MTGYEFFQASQDLIIQNIDFYKSFINDSNKIYAILILGVMTNIGAILVQIQIISPTYEKQLTGIIVLITTFLIFFLVLTFTAYWTFVDPEIEHQYPAKDYSIQNPERHH